MADLSNSSECVSELTNLVVSRSLKENPSHSGPWKARILNDFQFWIFVSIFRVTKPCLVSGWWPVQD
jgi:hypothetical protein